MGGLDRKKPWNPDWLLKNNCYRFKKAILFFLFYDIDHDFNTNIILFKNVTIWKMGRYRNYLK